MARIRTRTGFTLVELLVVMSIIMVLAGISMPVYSRYRASAYGVKCQANLRSIGLAFTTYQTGYGGWMPYGLSDNNCRQTDKNGKAVKWKYDLSFYLGNHTSRQLIKRSYPLHKAFFDPIKGVGEGNYFLSYMQFGEKIQVKDIKTDDWVDYYEYSDGFKIDADGRRVWTAREVLKPVGYMAYASWKSPEMAAIVTEAKDPKMHRGYARDPKKKTINVEYRHGGKANVLFLDAHIEQFDKTDDRLWMEPNGKAGGLFDKKIMEDSLRTRQLPLK